MSKKNNTKQYQNKRIHKEKLKDISHKLMCMIKYIGTRRYPVPHHNSNIKYFASHSCNK